jgi:colanic acid/amylovoran biosynthesis glycosyltransferase
MKLAYLVNIYPRASHSFIRREILALEAAGAQVRRFSIRACDTPLVDETDRAEHTKTRVILGVGVSGLLLAMLRTLFTSPKLFLSALATAVRLGRASDRGVIKHIAYFAEACVLRKWLADSPDCHLHAHFGTNSAAVAMLCHKLGGPPFSFTVHGPEEFERATMLALDEKVATARFVVAISEFGRGQLCRWSDPNDWPKLRVVHCGVDDRFLTSLVPPIPDRPRLLCVGRLCTEKGQYVLLEAARLMMLAGTNFELVLAGDGPIRSRLEKQIERFGLQERVRLTGWLSSEQVKQEILMARAMVAPSFAEGLPVVIMESLALGRPVISTSIAGIPELLKPGVNGWLVPSGSPEKLAAAMTEAIVTPLDRLGRMGSEGARAVADRHDVRREAAKLSDLFNQSAEFQLS